MKHVFYDGPIVVCGFGIVSCLGNTPEDVTDSLRHLRSGIVLVPAYADMHFRSKVAGVPKPVDESRIDRSRIKEMAPAVVYNIIAAMDAIAMANLPEALLKSPRTGAIMATGAGSPAHIRADTTKVLKQHEKNQADGGTKQSSRFAGVTTTVARTMGSTNSANAEVVFGFQGPSYTLSSACASGAIAIGDAAQQIVLGKADVMLAGSGDELSWELTSMFDGLGALAPSGEDDDASKVSRPFDKDRKGFVIGGGGACLVLARRDVAEAHGMPVLAVLAGYANTSDGGTDMTNPTTEGPARCMRQALESAGMTPDDVQYINAHGTSTGVGDINETTAVQAAMGDDWQGWISSTKALTGHPLGTAGTHEAVYSLLALQGGFVPGSANIDELDSAIAALPISERIARTTFDKPLTAVMSNSFGFGGTNASLIFSKAD